MSAYLLDNVPWISNGHLKQLPWSCFSSLLPDFSLICCFMVNCTSIPPDTQVKTLADMFNLSSLTSSCKSYLGSIFIIWGTQLLLNTSVPPPKSISPSFSSWITAITSQLPVSASI
jgi:hypothetical protein